MALPLDDCKAKLGRVEEQLADLKECAGNYSSHFYARCRHNDVKKGEIVFKLLQESPDPIDVRVRAGEILHNLRSPLDYLVSAIVERAGNKPTRRNEFPIALDAREFSRIADNKLAGTTLAERTLIEGLQPYNGGNGKCHPLHLLTTWNNVDKHRLIQAGIAIPRHVGFTVSTPGVGYEVRKICKFESMKAGAHLLTLGVLDGVDPREVQVDIGLTVDVFFRHRLDRWFYFPAYESLYAIWSYLHENVFSDPGLASAFGYVPERNMVLADWRKLFRQ